MLRRVRYIGRAISLFFRLFICRSLKVMFMPGQNGNGMPAPAPPVVARAEQSDISFLMLGFSLLVIVCIPLPYLWGGKGRPFIAITGLVALSVGYKAWRRLGAGGVSRLCREARDADCCLCLHCGYSLKGLPARHRCPECGMPYEIEDVKRKWSDYLADRGARRLPW